MSEENVNILLVDDQPGKLLSYEVMLNVLGENLIKAGSGREALSCLLRMEVALILIDVCMPDLDGFELAAIIRDHPRYKKIPIIFVSSIQVSDLDRLRGYEAGAVDYVPVPIVPEVLRAKVKIFAELYKKTRQLEQMNQHLERRVAERTAALEASSRELRELNQKLEERVVQETREREGALARLFEAQKMDTIGQLTGGVAHDFNNLLMAVMGSLELLKKQLPDDTRTNRLLDTAIRGAERGAALTQRLLTFSRRQELRPEAVNVAVLLAGMEDLLERSLGPGVQIKNMVTRDCPLAQVDANQLELAILNLAVNARDAMPNGGSLTISAVEETLLALSNDGKLAPGHYLRLSVSDTGVGMNEETIAKASEPFFTTKGVGKGTGLGLSTVHGLAAQSGGAMYIDSRLGEGTTVHIWLRKAEANASPKPMESVVGLCKAVPLMPCRVLLVDDDPLVRAGTAAMLEDLGHTVREAKSAAEALELLSVRPLPDLVITDHAMPEMTGLELAHKIRTYYGGLPVIIATGYANLLQSRDAEKFPRLSKPFRQNELVRALCEVLPPAQHINVA